MFLEGTLENLCIISKDMTKRKVDEIKQFLFTALSTLAKFAFEWQNVSAGSDQLRELMDLSYTLQNSWELKFFNINLNTKVPNCLNLV